MEFKLFDDYITLQALLKEQGIIQSGGAIKSFLLETTVLFNGEVETRRGKKIRIGDVITLPEHNIDIRIMEPTESEKLEHSEKLAEKERIDKIVKQMNHENKKKQKAKRPKIPLSKQKNKTKCKPVRFPGI